MFQPTLLDKPLSRRSSLIFDIGDTWQKINDSWSIVVPSRDFDPFFGLRRGQQYEKAHVPSVEKGRLIRLIQSRNCLSSILSTVSNVLYQVPFSLNSYLRRNSPSRFFIPFSPNSESFPTSFCDLED